MAFPLLLYILLYPEIKVFVPMTSMKTTNSLLTVTCVSVSSLTSYITPAQSITSSCLIALKLSAVYLCTMQLLSVHVIIVSLDGSVACEYYEM